MRSREEIKVFLKQMYKFNGNMDARALAFAEFAHEGQTDKAGQQYIQHPVRVAQNVDKTYENQALTAIAYMHDVVEDGNFSISDLSAYFPKCVWGTVDILTRRKSEDRKKYIEAVGQNLLATKVKIADLEDNMDLSRLPFPTDKDIDRQGRYIDEYKYLKERLNAMEAKYPVEEQDPDTYAEFYM